MYKITCTLYQVLTMAFTSNRPAIPWRLAFCSATSLDCSRLPEGVHCALHLVKHSQLGGQRKKCVHKEYKLTQHKTPIAQFHVSCSSQFSLLFLQQPRHSSTKKPRRRDKHHQDATRTQPRQDRDTTGTSPGHHQDTTKTQPDTAKIAPRYHQDTTETPPRHNRDTTKIRPRHNRDTTKTQPRHNETSSEHHRDTTMIPPR